jgi:hypothetical protein
VTTTVLRVLIRIEWPNPGFWLWTRVPELDSIAGVKRLPIVAILLFVVVVLELGFELQRRLLVLIVLLFFDLKVFINLILS